MGYCDGHLLLGFIFESPCGAKVCTFGLWVLWEKDLLLLLFYHSLKNFSGVLCGFGLKHQFCLHPVSQLILKVITQQHVCKRYLRGTIFRCVLSS